MVVPTLVDVAASVGSASAATPDVPAGVLTNDILICWCANSAGDPMTLSGGTETWTELANASVSGERAMYVFWARASQNNPTSPTTNDTGAQNFAVMAAFRGCIETEDPYEAVATDTETSSDTSVTVPGGTTTKDNCLILAGSGHGGTANYVTGSSWANGNLANVESDGIINEYTSISSDTTIIVTTGEKVAAGSVGNTTCTITSADNEKCLISFALKPKPSSNFPPIRNINQAVKRAATY